MKTFLLLVLALLPCALAQTCASAHLCREETSMMTRQNSAWVTRCPPNPNTMAPGLDPRCNDIGNCPAAGAFGWFLRAVTNRCNSKHFDDYFGLDGLTFGILHFTANELPKLFQYYKDDPAAGPKFDQIFPFLGANMNGRCLNPTFVCNSNKNGYFNCDPTFRPAFTRSVNDPDMQKVQLKLAYEQYTRRVSSLTQYNFRTNFAIAAMTAVMNNLPDRDGCRISQWVSQCASSADEPAKVRCMLDIYARNGCRNSVRGAESRRNAILAVFNGIESTPYQPAGTLQQVLACTSQWGVPSPRGRASTGAHAAAPSAPGAIAPTAAPPGAATTANPGTPATAAPNAPAAPAAGGAASSWRTQDGVTIFTFPANAFHLFSAPTTGGQSPMTVSQALSRDTAAVAALDGPMFVKCAGQTGGYSTYTCGLPDYLHKDTSRNVNIPTRFADRGITLSVNAAGAVTMQRGANPAADAVVAVQTYPSLVESGRNTASATVNTDTTWRAAVGVLNSGEMFFAVGNMNMNTFAAKLITLGARHAGYTDGGGSARLQTRNPARTAGSSENRRVITFMVATAESATAPAASPAADPANAAEPAPAPLPNNQQQQQQQQQQQDQQENSAPAAPATAPATNPSTAPVEKQPSSGSSGKGIATTSSPAPTTPSSGKGVATSPAPSSGKGLSK